MVFFVFSFFMLDPLYFILYFKKMTKSNFPLYIFPFPFTFKKNQMLTVEGC